MREQLLSYLKLLEARVYSPTRIGQTTEVVEKLICYCKNLAIENWPEVSIKILEGFFEQQSKFVTYKGKERAAMTLSCWKSALRGFFTYLLNNQEILVNPALQLRVKREKSFGKQPLSYKEIEKLLELPNTEKRYGIRDRAIMELLYSTGMRISEVYKLNLYDVSLTTKEVMIRETKTKKVRKLPLTKQAVYWIEEYLREVRPLLAEKKKSLTDALWISCRGKRMTMEAMSLNIRTYGEVLGLKISANTFRHTFASHLLENGANIFDIKRFLGHSSLYATQIYSHTEAHNLKQVVEKASKH